MRVRTLALTVLTGISAVAVPAAAMEVAAPARPKVAATPAPAAVTQAPPAAKPTTVPPTRVAAAPAAGTPVAAPVASTPGPTVAPAPAAPPATERPAVKEPVRVPPDKQELTLQCVAGRPDGAPAVKCRWSAAVGAHHYLLLRKTAGATAEPEPLHRGPDTWFVDRTVVEGTGYGYAVKAIDANGRIIGRGGIAWVRCCGEQPPEPRQMRLACVAGQPDGAPAVKCQWSPLDGADHYVLYRKVEGADPERIYAGTDTTFVDRAVAGGTAYHYGVKAIGAGGRVVGMSAFVAVRCCPAGSA